jgi:hypothetical protein
VKSWMRRRLRWIESGLVSRGVSRASLRLAAAIVSATAGVVLAAGGVVREPRVWVLVPLLGLSRLVLDALSDDLEA